MKKIPKIVIVIIIALLVSIVNYLAYPVLIDKKFEKISIPVVKNMISEFHMIKDDDIEYLTVYKNTVTKNIYTSANEIVGKYLKAGYTLDTGMYFYKGTITSENELMGDIGSNIENNKNLFSLKIDANDSINNNINSGEYIDLYFTGYDSYHSGKLVFGMLLEHVLIKQVVYESNNKINYIILSLTQTELDYLVRGSNVGKITPVISSYSNSVEVNPENYYSVSRLHMFIDEYSTSFNNGVNNVTAQ